MPGERRYLKTAAAEGKTPQKHWERVLLREWCGGRHRGPQPLMMGLIRANKRDVGRHVRPTGQSAEPRKLRTAEADSTDEGVPGQSTPSTKLPRGSLSLESWLLVDLSRQAIWPMSWRTRDACHMNKLSLGFSTRNRNQTEWSCVYWPRKWLHSVLRSLKHWKPTGGRLALSCVLLPTRSRHDARRPSLSRNETLERLSTRPSD